MNSAVSKLVIIAYRLSRKDKLINVITIHYQVQSSGNKVSCPSNHEMMSVYIHFLVNIIKS